MRKNVHPLFISAQIFTFRVLVVIVLITASIYFLRSRNAVPTSDKLQAQTIECLNAESFHSDSDSIVIRCDSTGVRILDKLEKMDSLKSLLLNAAISLKAKEIKFVISQENDVKYSTYADAFSQVNETISAYYNHLSNRYYKKAFETLNKKEQSKIVEKHKVLLIETHNS